MKRQPLKRGSFFNLWMILIIILTLFGTGLYFVYHLYSTTLQNREEQFEQSKSYILSNKYIKEIKHAEALHELESYHIFFGKNVDEEDVIVFLPGSFDEDHIVVLKQKDIIKEQKALETIAKQCSQCQNINIKPGMINGNPLWEITYFDEHKRYNMDYISMIDGSRYERLQLKQTFK